MNGVSLRTERKRIRWLAMDVDGTLTDGGIYLSENGEEFKAFNAKDGYGIRHLLPALGIEAMVITGRSSQIVCRRCAELGVQRVYQGVADKAAQLASVIPKGELAKVAYIGDDLNDLSAMEAVHSAGGLVGCPSDAVADVRQIADCVLRAPGGRGAVREFIDWLMED